MRALVLLSVLALSGCDDDVPDECAASDGESATCAQACENLTEIDCRPESTRQECESTCEAAGQSLDEDVAGRARACYAAAQTCAEVEGCSRSCGPDDGPVPWERVDAGDGSADAGP